MALLFSAALLTALALPLFARVGVLVGAVDLPDGGRKRHAAPTPRFAAPALYIALMGALGLLGAPSARTAALLTGGGLIAALGVTDDVCPLSPRAKLAAELVIAAIPPCFGLLPEAIGLFGRTLPLSPVAAWSFTLLWVAALGNAYNMIDGLDGLAAGQCAVTTLGFLLYAPSPTAAALCGAALGFLPYNHPYRLRNGRVRTASFLGDGGALLLGYGAALLSLDRVFSVSSLWLYAVPLYDLVSSILRRLARGKSPFAADGGHLHHRLCALGLSKGQTVILLLAVAALCAAFSLWGAVPEF